MARLRVRVPDQRPATQAAGIISRSCGGAFRQAQPPLPPSRRASSAGSSARRPPGSRSARRRCCASARPCSTPTTGATPRRRARFRRSDRLQPAAARADRHGGVGAVQARPADRSSSGRRRAGHQPRAVGDHRGAVRRASPARARPLRRTLFVVGDEKQSIMSVQGADVATYRRFRESIREPRAGGRQPWREEPLGRSFRSAKPILDLVDAVFADPRCATAWSATPAGRPTNAFGPRRPAWSRSGPDRGRAGAKADGWQLPTSTRRERAGRRSSPRRSRADLRVAARARRCRPPGADPRRRHHDPAAAPRHPPGAADQEPQAAAGAGRRRRPAGAHRRDRGRWT